MNEYLNYSCPKCSGTRCEIGKIYAPGGFWSKIFDVQGRRFSTVTCSNCRYTELYQADGNSLANIFDLFTG